VKRIELNEAQKGFVHTNNRYAGFFGGIGAGKTFTLILRALELAQQPKPEGAMYGPRGMITATNYPNLMDAVLPQFFEIIEGTDLLISYERQRKIAHLKNGADIYFRSLDDPNNIRGVELAYFAIDEGRNVDRRSWDILVGRLRQKGYDHRGWVCSTPNGWDWMWQIFHEDSPEHLPQAKWYGASTLANAENLPKEYIDDLALSYNGDWYRQEVLGEFVGLMAGAVFPHWHPKTHTTEITYDPELPLYSFWDFGIGDLGVCLFAQIDHLELPQPDGRTFFKKRLKFLDIIEAKDWTAADWAQAWHDWLDLNTGGRKPNMNIGDPAGRQRTMVSGTSVMEALSAEGVNVIPAPKKPQDYSIRILDNMMAGNLVLADGAKCARLSGAFATHHWKTDDNGTRVGVTPIHDWTSHFADAARYGAAVLLSFRPEITEKPPGEAFHTGQMGYILDQIDNPETGWIGDEQEGEKPLLWTPVALAR
jgi:hypothetical protein